jgi:endonuclease VIII
MPEGDTIFRTARTLDRALSGHAITAFETQIAALVTVDRRAPVKGRTVHGVEARGKHVLISLSADLWLRTHLRMHGSWHIYRPGERWRAPRRDARIVISTAEWLAIAFSVTDAEFLTSRELDHHSRLGALGPDLLGGDFDCMEARRRIRLAPATHIAEALLRQQSIAGLGNVFKSELLFDCRVFPFAPVAGISDAKLGELIERARTLITLNVAEQGVVAGSSTGRITTGRLNPREQLWVYGRTGRPCLRCGTAIMSRGETEGRRTYWCPSCQPDSTFAR